MVQKNEIHTAFRQAMRQDGRGGCTVSTRDFVAELHQRNWPFTPRAANNWREIHISIFRDVSYEAGEFQLVEGG